ncbi:MAG: TrmH family RNA methyltransferase [Lachnospiraceae bacterium]|nr:TrmH family RNA methyltransferase [Lachnospiraceae bacterium]
MKVERYKRDLDHSYTLGATLTFELMKLRPDLALRVFICSDTQMTDSTKELIAICEKNHVEVEKNDKAFNILSPKGNCYVIGMFRKEKQKMEAGDHLMFVNPSDAGNMGTILRTATGFGYKDIAIIAPAVDVYDPKTVRASMGALFHVRVEYFDTIDDYRKLFEDNHRYAFMLTSSKDLEEVKTASPYTLIYGNEATGLPEEYASFCETVIITHSKEIDSLNLPMAAGISMYRFRRK